MYVTVAGPESNALAPWLEIIIPSTLCSHANAASSAIGTNKTY